MTLHFGDAFVNLMPQLLSSLLVVLQITLFGFSLALVVGFAIALGRLSKSKVLRGILIVIVEFFRGTPLLVQCFYIYFVFPVLFKMVGLDNIRITAVTAGVIGFGLNYGCYMSEVIRSAILSVDHGQMEAGLALGYKKSQVMAKFIIPPAVRNSIPVFGNYLITMVKDTSILASISVAEMLLVTKNYAGRTFQTVESYTILALMYLVISLPLSRLVSLLERKLGKSEKGHC